MEPILSRDQARALDARVIAAGVPSVILMENAGRGAADIIVRNWPGARLLVVCGSGNNAGDGLVVARRWLVWGLPVCAWLTTRALSLDAMTELRAYEACGGRCARGESAVWEAELGHADVLVDALLGTGLSRPVSGPLQSLIEAINTSGKPVVALDLPSGLDCDRGVELGLSVRAHTTVSFGCAKRGTFTSVGKLMCGHVEVVDIGAPLPIEAVPRDAVAWRVRPCDVQSKLGMRAEVSHKGQAGHVLIVAGSAGTTGAALLAARGAFRAGAGSVTIATHADTVGVLDTQSPEVMKVSLVAGQEGVTRLAALMERATSVVVGPGLGFSADAGAWVEYLLQRFAGTVVVDADAITWCTRLTAWSRRGNLVFTPHPGEAARLLATTSHAIEADRFAALDRLVQHTAAAVVLKGAPSLVAYDTHRYVSHPGASCMSTAGSGDVLAGVIGALGCQLGTFDAAWVGAWVHAAAGELWAQEHGYGRGMMATELADHVPLAIAKLNAVRRVGSV